MKTIKIKTRKIFKPVRKLYYYNYEVILRTEMDSEKPREKFDKHFLSEDDLDKIMAVI